MAGSTTKVTRLSPADAIAEIRAGAPGRYLAKHVRREKD